MSKSKYENESALKSYIQEIIKFRSKKDALNYINSKLKNYSFSSDFIDWANSKIVELNAEPTVTNPDQKNKIQKPEPCPEIFFGSLNRDTEKEHISSVKKHIKFSERELFERIEYAKGEMSDLRDSIRNSTADDRPDLIREHLRYSHQKNDLAYKARFVTSAINNPYFGRFDFRDEKNNEKVLYISKTDVKSYVSNHHDVSFIDWRSPIADVFYRYQSPLNGVSFRNDLGEESSGDLALTARFKIENGVIKDISYSSSRGNTDVEDAANDILQDKLNSNSGEFMTEIVETIQPEQNAIVRHDPGEDMIVQGVAGSGKTAVALHRIAYIVYRKPELRNGGVLFVSPNDVFSNYVSDVLPELGEFNIPIVTFSKAADLVLNGGKGNTVFKSDSLKDFVEAYYHDGKLKDNIKEKFSASFIKSFRSLCASIQRDGLKRAKYLSYRDELMAVKHDIRTSRDLIEIYEQTIKKSETSVEYCNQKIPELKEQLSNETDRKEKKKIQDYLKLVQLDHDKALGAIKESSAKIKKENDKLNSSLADEAKLKKQYAALRPYIHNSEVFVVKKDKNNKEIVQLKKSHLAYYKTLCSNTTVRQAAYENAPYLAILKLLISKANGESRENLKVQHIVIDEAQDYIEPYVFFLRIAYPNATFTILGDINQNVNPYYKHKSLEKLLPNAEYFEMDKAYRSSPEIVNYCNSILNITSVKPVRKSRGEKVTEKTIENFYDDLRSEVSRYQKSGYVRIGIITKDQAESNKIKEILPDEDIVILPVYQAKGLEFDVAIVIDTFSKKEKELFYVACSRAQHGLTVLSRSSNNKKVSGDGKRPLDDLIEDDETEDATEVDATEEEPVIKTSKKRKTKVKETKRRGLFRKLRDAFSAAIDAFRGK